MHDVITEEAKTNKLDQCFQFKPPVHPSASFQCILGGNTRIHPCLTSQGHFQCKRYVWMPMAGGLTPAFQASDAQAGDPSQLAGLPSNLPVTSANDKTRRNGYRNSAAYWQWQLQFTGKERLISSKQLPFPLRERKRDSPRLSWRQRVQTEVYILFSPTHSQSIIFGDSKCLLWQ